MIKLHQREGHHERQRSTAEGKKLTVLIVETNFKLSNIKDKYPLSVCFGSACQLTDELKMICVKTNTKNGNSNKRTRG